MKRRFIDTSKANFLQEFISLKPTLSSYQYEWKDISFLHVNAPPGEIPEHECPQHIITIPLILPQNIITVETLVKGTMKSVNFCLGDITIEPSNITRRTILFSSVECYNISLEPSLINHIDVEQFNPDSIELLPTIQRNDPLIYHIAKKINDELESGKPLQIYIDSLKTCLAAHLLKNFSSKDFCFNEYSGGLSSLKLRMVTEFINDNLSENISLNILSKLVDISPYYFSRLFKQSTGLSPCQYIIKQRINKAKNLLSNQDLDIADIALICGFTHQSHLNRYFKKHTGTTPKKFRKSQ
ncbi:helix-turn-helix domain-containing protein [Acaryochloris marina]|uniref:helix-turn-helix domain-containing protein n=1 Tax=Acaryochloris marina TaxID=155978 RepID=UPI0021C38A50|nr:AraC family transcriptional regulator [Acaryochloris marina]BDM83777.1 hypothetical protein AM10699_66380 [Acaryochloris marina MBIC10699]